MIKINLFSAFNITELSQSVDFFFAENQFPGECKWKNKQAEMQPSDPLNGIVSKNN